MNQLTSQIKTLGLENKIKISSLKDNKIISIGAKRNKLLQNATGKYVAFIDDDDDVSDDYIKLIFDALIKNPDCVGIIGTIFENNNMKYFIHSKNYNTYFERNNAYYRPPNHINPIRRTIALKVPYPDKSIGEDTEWAIELCSRRLLTSEQMVYKPIYIYNSS